MGIQSLEGITVSVVLRASLRNLLTDLTVAGVAHTSLNWSASIADGINANQANRSWQSANRILTNGGSEDIDIFDFASIDLGAGTGLDGLGQALAFEEIVAVAIVNKNEVGAAGQLEIDPSVANGWTPIGTHTVANGGALRGQGILFKAQPAEAGFEVTDGVSYRVRFRATNGPVTYSIYLLARHDDEESSSSPSSSSSSSPSSSSSQSMSTSSASESTSSSSESSESSSSQSSSSWSSSST